jgi:hypothetical protein
MRRAVGVGLQPADGSVPLSFLVRTIGRSFPDERTPGAPPAAGTAQREHRRLHAAPHELREARSEVRNAGDDFGGHRDKALRATDDAVASLKLLLRIKGDGRPGARGSLAMLVTLPLLDASVHLDFADLPDLSFWLRLGWRRSGKLPSCVPEAIAPAIFGVRSRLDQALTRPAVSSSVRKV